MKAARISEFGDSNKLHIVEVSKPVPEANEVLIRVLAAGVNPVDAKMRDGIMPQFLFSAGLPTTLGCDVAGEIAAIGDKVDAWKIGDRVFAMTPDHQGGYAEYAVLPTALIAAIPANLDDVHAGAVPLAGITAWQGLFTYGQLKAGQRVLVHAGAGGVGHFAVQSAKAIGAHVFATAAAEHLDLVRGFGADVVIDYKAERFEAVASDLDLVFDTIGGETRKRSWGIIKPGGSLITTIDKPDQATAAGHNVRAMRFTAEANADDLSSIARLIEAGKVAPHVSATFKLEEAAKAQDALRGGGKAGKTVLVMGVRQ